MAEKTLNEIRNTFLKYFEKIVDPDLHPDTAEEKAEKLQKVLNKKS